jgi:hypothetical protein
MKKYQTIKISDRDIDLYLEAETNIWLLNSIDLFEKGIPEVSEDISKFLAEVWKKRIQSIHYEEIRTIEFSTFSMRTILVPNRDLHMWKSHINRIFKIFLKVFREDFKQGEGDAYERIKYDSWDGSMAILCEDIT